MGILRDLAWPILLAAGLAAAWIVRRLARGWADALAVQGSDNQDD